MKEIIKKYNLTNQIKKLEEIENLSTIKIAFLGEFSSGKSTLINSILEKNILPTSDKPTSKRIVEIIGSDVEKTEAYIVNNGKYESISLYDFQELSVSNGEKAILKIPYNDFLKKDYIFIDTPGVGSLDKTDTDITFGYLNAIDGAIICQDIQQGTLTKSIIQFLEKDEIKNIKNNFVFAITKADTKDALAQEKIKEDVINQLKNLGITNPEKKVALTSKNNVDELKKVIENNIFTKAKELLEQRKQKEFKNLKQEIIENLKYQKENANLNLADIEKKEDELKSELLALELQQKELNNKISTLKDYIKEDIQKELSLFLKKAPELDNEALQKEIEALKEEITNIVYKNIKRFLNQNIDIKVKEDSYQELIDEIESLLKKIEIGETIANILLLDWFLPGTGLFGVIVGGAAKVIGSSYIEKNKELKSVAEQFEKINPVNILTKKAKEFAFEKYQDEFNTKLDKSVSQITQIIENEMEVIFEELKQNIQTKQQLLNELNKTKQDKMTEFSKYLADIETDIQTLEK